MRRTHPGIPAARRGSVIVVVLVTLLLASLMIVKFMESSAVELTLATRQADRERLRGDAYAALETVLAVMAEVKAIDEALYAPEQGWADPYAYAGEAPREGVTVSYEFTDESGKASLPKMTFDEMVELAQVLGLGDTDARRFADGLYAWMKEDHMPKEIEAEASRYERDDPPITVPKRSLRSWGELRAVKVARDYVYDENGALTPFGTALQQNVSLYSFEGTNVNALAPALGTARGWDGTQAAQLAGYR
ncbi:MAG: general secretion pathway protein GspK, partial [Burkholderiales bacterium]|nr:general secretion pathway protein GspK [Opitutaceae bacterium]